MSDTPPRSESGEPTGEADELQVDYEHRTTLYKLIGKRDFDGATSRMQTHPAECRTWIATNYQDGTDNTSKTWFKRLPLHVACERQPPRAFMITLASKFPGALLLGDEIGRIPLIHACIRKASLDAIDGLLTVDPSAIKHTDDNGRTPISWACEFDADTSVVSSLLDRYPESASVVDVYSRVLLHWECASLKMSKQLVTKILSMNPGAATISDSDGKTPLDLARENILCSARDEIVALMEAHAEMHKGNEAAAC